MRIRCQRKEPFVCTNRWDYRGKKKIFATCPECRYLNRIKNVKKS